jgi:hypothetical protein
VNSTPSAHHKADRRLLKILLSLDPNMILLSKVIRLKHRVELAGML